MEKDIIKYTPGPWYLVQYAHAFTIQDGPKYGDRDLLAFENSFDNEKCPEAEANAQLASCAPEMLEALESLIFTATKLWDEVKPIKDSGAMKVTHPIIEEAKFIVEKAKGGKQ